MDFSELSVECLLTKLVELGFDQTREERSCKFTDRDFVQLGCQRVLGSFQSGRDFLQHQHEVEQAKIARSTFFKALQSSRRLQVCEDVSRGILKVLNEQMDTLEVDYLKQFSALNEYEVYAGDGHFIEHACHTKLIDSKKEQRRTGKLPKLHAAGLIYMQNLRNGLLSLFAPVSDGTRKNHEMPIFRNHYEKFKAQTNKRVIYVLDRAYVDKVWWSRKMGPNVDFISRSKSNFSLTMCGDMGFDDNKEINQGVKRDFLAGLGGNSAAFRFIDYKDPETGNTYQFYTSNMDLEPGLIAWLYFKRWTIEKTYDTSKNSLCEQKAWATGEGALQVQAHFICVVYNILRFINEITLKSMDEDEKISYRKKYADWIKKREEKAIKKGRSINLLLKNSLRMPKIAIQFIRFLKNNFHSPLPLRRLLPILRLRLINYVAF